MSSGRRAEYEGYCHNIVRHDQTKPPLGLKEPLNPTVAVMFKFQQELAFVAFGIKCRFALAIEPSYIAIFEAENLNIGCISALP